MKKALLLALVCFISCTNNQQSNNTTDSADSVAVVEKNSRCFRSPRSRGYRNNPRFFFIPSLYFRR